MIRKLQSCDEERQRVVGWSEANNVNNNEATTVSRETPAWIREISDKAQPAQSIPLI